MEASGLTDVALARALAEEAGRLLLNLRQSGTYSGRALGDAGDRAANTHLIDHLRRARPDDAILSEEAADDAKRLDCRRVWIIDPLDGTREYSEGRDDWAVHVALAIDGEPATGAVALPALDLVLDSGDPVAIPAAHSPPRMLVSRSRPPREATEIAAAIGAELVEMGSAGAKAMAVLRGVGDIYLHSGGQYEWDNCAPAAVALAAGLHASRIDGSPLRYNRPNVALPDLLICRKEMAPDLLARVAAVRAPEPR